MQPVGTLSCCCAPPPGIFVLAWRHVVGFRQFSGFNFETHQTTDPCAWFLGQLYSSVTEIQSGSVFNYQTNIFSGQNFPPDKGLRFFNWSYNASLTDFNLIAAESENIQNITGPIAFGQGFNWATTLIDRQPTVQTYTVKGDYFYPANPGPVGQTFFTSTGHIDFKDITTLSGPLPYSDMCAELVSILSQVVPKAWGTQNNTIDGTRTFSYGVDEAPYANYWQIGSIQNSFIHNGIYPSYGGPFGAVVIKDLWGQGSYGFESGGQVNPPAYIFTGKPGLVPGVGDQVIGDNSIDMREVLGDFLGANQVPMKLLRESDPDPIGVSIGLFLQAGTGGNNDQGSSDPIAALGQTVLKYSGPYTIATYRIMSDGTFIKESVTNGVAPNASFFATPPPDMFNFDASLYTSDNNFPAPNRVGPLGRVSFLFSGTYKSIGF